MKKELGLVFLIIISLSSLSFVYAEDNVGGHCDYLFAGTSSAGIQTKITENINTLNTFKAQGSKFCTGQCAINRIAEYESIIKNLIKQKAWRDKYPATLTTSQKAEMAKDFCGGTCYVCGSRDASSSVSWGVTYICDYVDGPDRYLQDTCPTDYYCDGQGNCITDKCYVSDAYFEKEDGTRVSAGEVFEIGIPLTCVVKTKNCDTSKDRIDFGVKSVLIEESKDPVTGGDNIAKGFPISRDPTVVGGGEARVNWPTKIAAKKINEDGTIGGLSNYDKFVCQGNIYQDSLIKRSDKIEVKMCAVEDAKVTCDPKNGGAKEVEITTNGACKDDEKLNEMKANIEKAPAWAVTVFMPVIKIFRAVGVPGEDWGVILEANDFIKNRGNPEKSIPPLKSCPPKKTCDVPKGDVLGDCMGCENGNPVRVLNDAPKCGSCGKCISGGIEKWGPYANNNLACILDTGGYGICKEGKCLAEASKCASKSCKNICVGEALQKYKCDTASGKCVADGKPVTEKGKVCVDGGWLVANDIKVEWGVGEAVGWISIFGLTKRFAMYPLFSIEYSDAGKAGTRILLLPGISHISNSKIFKGITGKRKNSGTMVFPLGGNKQCMEETAQTKT